MRKVSSAETEILPKIVVHAHQGKQVETLPEIVVHAQRP
jgi:predicted small metal-binding protein